MIGKAAAGLTYALNASREMAATTYAASPFHLTQDYSTIEQFAV